MGVFRFLDRWHPTLGALWGAGKDDPGAMAQMLQLLEQRDRDLENYLDAAIPRGIVALTAITSSSYTQATSTTTAVTNATVTASLSTNRQYRITFLSRWTTTNTDSQLALEFYEAGVISKTGRFGFDHVALGECCDFTHVFTPTAAGEVTWTVQAFRGGAAPTGTLALFASAPSPCQLFIEDIGAAL